MGTMVRAESSLERDAFYHLEWGSDVVRHAEQALEISGANNGKPITHFPDIYVSRRHHRKSSKSILLKANEGFSLCRVVLKP